ncbi:MAG: hypothetical protein IJQ34_02060 [Kiritimatiellae bacterium]|nr:hypothetical protein [Kiritimatiellia bacterium]
MNNAAEYTAALLDTMPPELIRRIEKESAKRKKTVEEIIIYFLAAGANTPILLGSGANTFASTGAGDSSGARKKKAKMAS